MKRMTEQEALKEGFCRYRVNQALNNSTGEIVELFTPLEAEMLAAIVDIEEVWEMNGYVSEKLKNLIKKARGD